jgi:hypothetical protein
VVRLALPGGRFATDTWRDLSERGVHVLPCRQFFWADPQAGERFVRVALSRPAAAVTSAATTIRRYFDES